MHTPMNYIAAAWIVAVVVWVIGAVTTKRTTRRQSLASRLLHVAGAWTAFFLFFARRAESGLLLRRFVPHSLLVSWTGVALTLAGVALAICARVFLGGNWSAAVTIKKGHSLVLRGPYALVRHPIYSGLLLGIFGTALAIGEIRALLATVVVLVMLLHKIILEEKFMLEQFGKTYVEYRRSVKGLIPFVW